jgi:hypothetical protein
MLRHHPSTLLVIGHVKEDDLLLGIVQSIEIGTDSWLPAPEWDEHVRLPEAPPPLVLLLGCEAGSPEVDILGFVAGVMAGGAGILMTTSSTIHSVHAVKLVETLFPKLKETCAREGTFGEALRDARRAMLAEGSPMPLCLVAYGDADWRLTQADWLRGPRERAAEAPLGHDDDGAEATDEQEEAALALQST